MYLVVCHPNQDTWKRHKVPTLKSEMGDLLQLRLKEIEINKSDNEKEECPHTAKE